ncbi:MAG: PAS domain-containing protein [Candidatus Hydrogenedentes bacterium]|nr:PAS domain-containing protein [Candidatus Hydrogenedentota bacterium]
MTKRSLPPLDEHCPIPIIRVDEEGIVCAFNPAAAEVFGLTANRRRRAVSLIPELKSVGVERLIAEEGETGFDAIVDDKPLRVTVLGIHHHKLAQVYCAPTSASPVTSEKADSEDAAGDTQHLLQSYQQQLKELSCFYGLAELLRTQDSIEEVCTQLVSLIPPAWRHPDWARARILLDGREYASQAFDETRWGQSAAVVVNNRARGMVQVFYVREVPGSREHGPFLAAERKLLDALARTLGEALERREFEQDNRRKAIILAQERNRLETILRGMGEGVVVTDTSNIVLMMNAAAMVLLGLPNREPIATDFLSLLTDEVFCSAWQKKVETGEDFAKLDLHVGTPFRRTLSVSRTRIPELVQGEDCFVTILHDVTKEREINQMKSDFVAAVSHELRTPMTSIKGFVRTIMQDPKMPHNVREHFLNIIDEETERLTHLIESLLEMGSIESGRAVLDLAPVELPKLVDTIIVSLRPAMTTKRIMFDANVPMDLPQITADSKRVYTIVANLLENATKFTPEQGRITLSAVQDAGEIVITVSDTGPGIPVDARERIFERFFQVRGGSVKLPGAGLGLFLVREMVTLHGGTVRVESEVGKGTTFTVRLPIDGPERGGTGVTGDVG